MVKTPMTGDESFDLLQERLEKLNIELEADILIVITDLNISNGEAKGLAKTIKATKASRKYLLCVDEEFFYKYQITLKEPKRILISDREKLIQLCKRLVSNHI